MRHRRLIIVGAGSFGRELFSWIRFDAPSWTDCEFGGFIDDNIQTLSNYAHYTPAVVSTISDYKPSENDILVMGISTPLMKLQVSDDLEKRGASFASFVHPSVLIGKNVQLSRGIVVCPNVVISCDARVEEFVTLNVSCTIGHDTKIGRGCTISAHADVTGFAELDEGVFLGSHASILPRAKVGRFARVGAGSVVLRKVSEEATVMGVPAKQILP